MKPKDSKDFDNIPIYIDVSKVPTHRTESLSDTVSVDYDEDGEICGIEVSENYGMDYGAETVVGIETDEINMDEIIDMFMINDFEKELSEIFGKFPPTVMGIA